MSLERDLMAEQVGHLDLTRYVAVNQSLTLREVLARMRDEKRNCALVIEAERLVGIFTERDALVRVVDNPETWDSPIMDVAHTPLATISPDKNVSQAVEQMNRGHFRNLPVIDSDKRVVGNLSQEALIQFLSQHFPEEVYNLPPDPSTIPDKRAGA